MHGKRLGHYEIGELLGKGGMGEVYLAEDTRLGRKVALKVLPPGTAGDPHRRERFEREARAVAALNHPNIVTIHSIEEEDGMRFLTMELVEGRSLVEILPEGGMALEPLLDLALALTDALSCAHRASIVHRDLKPGNLMLDAEGRLKVLDFGLAKLAHERSSAEETRTAISGGGPSGTVPYMSPEQLRGEPLDARSDIFSVGVVLHELATGSRPFDGGSSAEIVSSILRDAPASLSGLKPQLPEELGRIVLRCLEKEPDRRYRSARDLGSDLARLKRGGPPAPSRPAERALLDRPAVAVLPFANLSGDQEQEYFVDGITDDVITALSYWRWFPVIARNSTMPYKGKAASDADVGRALGARYVVEGSVRKSGRRVRITAQLADVSTGHQIWARRYDRDLTDIFALQDEISAQIVASIEPELSRAEQRRALRTVSENVDAWDCCHRALFHLGRGATRSDYDEAAGLLRRAVELDPSSSYANALLALCLYEQVMAGWSPDAPRGFQAVFELASRAVELDEGSWLGHLMKGMGHLWTRRAYGDGIEENRRAVELNPSAAQAYHGLACVLDYSGEWAAAIPELHTVMRLDPHYRHAASALADLSLSHLMLRQLDEALEFGEKAVRERAAFVRAHQRLACCLGHMGREERAREVGRTLLKRQPSFSLAYVDATYPFRHAEDRRFFLDGLRRAGLTLE